jgi:hypothetical protein
MGLKIQKLYQFTFLLQSRRRDPKHLVHIFRHL